MSSLTAERPPRESHLMDEDRAPRRTGIWIRVSEVDPETLVRRIIRRKQTWSIYRDPIIVPESPSYLPPCTCPICVGPVTR